MGNLCCGGAEDEVKPLLPERHRPRGSSTAASPASSRPSSRRTTPSRPPALDDNTSAFETQKPDNPRTIDGFVVRPLPTPKQKPVSSDRSRQRPPAPAELPLSVPATPATAAAAVGDNDDDDNAASLAAADASARLCHPTMSRPRGPLKRNPSRQHHRNVPRVAGDTLFLLETSGNDDYDDDVDENDDGKNDEANHNSTQPAAPRKDSGAEGAGPRSGMVALMPGPGFDPADLRRQLKKAGGGAASAAAGTAASSGSGGRGRPAPPPGAVAVLGGGFDASAARANLKSVPKKAST